MYHMPFSKQLLLHDFHSTVSRLIIYQQARAMHFTEIQLHPKLKLHRTMYASLCV